MERESWEDTRYEIKTVLAKVIISERMEMKNVVDNAQFSAIREQTLIPVSYTHLDVYKRQS